MVKVHKVFTKCVWMLVALFSTHNWRFIFTGQVKVRVFLKSGRHVDVYCKEGTLNLGAGNKSYKFAGLRHMVDFDPTEIVAMEVR